MNVIGRHWGGLLTTKAATGRMEKIELEEKVSNPSVENTLHLN